jgi:hypothetical protein
MKTRLLIILTFGVFGLNAQTTYDLDWYAGIGSNVDLTIDIGDTVRWTWTSINHTVTSSIGSTETFDSGFLGPIGSTYSHTFTLEGTNPYYCAVHGALSMSGTITVQNSLGLDEESFSSFKMFPNPSNSMLQLKFSKHISDGNITVFDILGKELFTKNIESTNALKLNISNWNKGIYLIKVKSESISQTKQFIKN